MAKKAVKAVIDPASFTLMSGTSSKGTYLPFARKGDILLGVKPEGAVNGGTMGVPHTVYFCARLRAAPNNGLLDQAAEGNVVTLKPKATGKPGDAFGGIEWDNDGTSRASTTVGAFIPGDFSVSNEKLLAELKEGLANSAMTIKMADYLLSLAGSADLLHTKEEIVAWLDSVYDPQINAVFEGISKQLEVQAAMTASVGAFGIQSALLKKIYAEKKAAKGEPGLEEEQILEDHSDDMDAEMNGDDSEYAVDDSGYAVDPQDGE
jgi:hypothetical protein